MGRRRDPNVVVALNYSIRPGCPFSANYRFGVEKIQRRGKNKRFRWKCRITGDDFLSDEQVGSAPATRLHAGSEIFDFDEWGVERYFDYRCRKPQGDQERPGWKLPLGRRGLTGISHEKVSRRRLNCESCRGGRARDLRIGEGGAHAEPGHVAR